MLNAAVFHLQQRARHWLPRRVSNLPKNRKKPSELHKPLQQLSVDLDLVCRQRVYCFHKTERGDLNVAHSEENEVRSFACVMFLKWFESVVVSQFPDSPPASAQPPQKGWGAYTRFPVRFLSGPALLCTKPPGCVM
ncbi:hypothetical protein ILYODFUR_039022 [Ilyodon furcidens]|uniref:Uncharacterized protein n=1 Tax=Ilyodon furcidens TaxID=33524 RepID=A0ABV0UCE8_9TELE